MTLGITDDDRERMGAFIENGHPSYLLGDNDDVRSKPIAERGYGESSAELAEYLRDHLSVGEVLFTEASELTPRVGRGAQSIGASLMALAENEPPGLDVSRPKTHRYPVTWRIEREER